MKVNCPFHDDHEPSCHIYNDGHYFCFVCRAYGPTEKLGPLEVIDTMETIAKPTDVSANLEYIDTLPVKEIRGLNLPYNDDGYFIVWPDRSYYKMRLWEGKGRYRNPKGVKKPILVFPEGSQNLVVIEGELNAMSLVQSVKTEETVCSPGPVVDFVRYIKFYLNYDHILIIADKDAAGAVYGKELRDLIASHGKRVQLYVTEKDFNQILQEEGPEGVRRAFERAKEMAL